MHRNAQVREREIPRRILRETEEQRQDCSGDISERWGSDRETRMVEDRRKERETIQYAAVADTVVVDLDGPSSYPSFYVLVFYCIIIDYDHVSSVVSVIA